MPWELCPKVCWRCFRVQKNSFRGLKGQFDVKKYIFRGLIAKIGHVGDVLALEIDFIRLKGQFAVKIPLLGE